MTSPLRYLENSVTREFCLFQNKDKKREYFVHVNVVKVCSGLEGAGHGSSTGEVMDVFMSYSAPKFLCLKSLFFCPKYLFPPG